MTDIRAFALDVDGTLTDGTVLWGPQGAEFKAFSFADIMGIARARKAGYHFALISGEDSELVTRFADKVGIVDVFLGCKQKDQALREFALRHDLSLTEICFVGDDVNDLPAMEIAGCSAAPLNGALMVRERVDYVLSTSGGHGAVRELLEQILPPGWISTH